MTRWLLLIVVCSAAAVASDRVNACPHLRLVLDAHLDAALVEREWASGNPRPELPAALELRGCAGQLLDRQVLEAPLAKLDPTPLRGAPAPTYLVTVDLTAEAGSYSGPLTLPIQIIQDQLRPVIAQAVDGQSQPVRLALTGKAAWKKVPVRRTDHLLAISCQPTGDGFRIYYRRYQPTRLGWRATTRVESGFWESGNGFPPKRLFPAGAVAPRAANRTG